jgi:hypothetical protein
VANEYAELATLKLSMKITDNAWDDLLFQALAAASRGIDTVCGRRFYLDGVATSRTYIPRGRTVCDHSGDRLLIDDIGAAGGLIVETGSGGSWTATTDYEPGPENALARGRPITSLLRSSSSWSGSATARVRVTAVWGWPAVPEEIVAACMIQSARLYKRKDSPEGVLGSAEWGVARLTRIDPDVAASIQHFILPGFG